MTTISVLIGSIKLGRWSDELFAVSYIAFVKNQAFNSIAADFLALETFNFFILCETRRLGRDHEIRDDVRPHPGPLPRERENRSPSLSDTDMWGYRASQHE